MPTDEGYRTTVASKYPPTLVLSQRVQEAKALKTNAAVKL
jgi:hypothetical protein